MKILSIVGRIENRRSGNFTLCPSPASFARQKSELAKHVGKKVCVTLRGLAWPSEIIFCGVVVPGIFSESPHYIFPDSLAEVSKSCERHEGQLSWAKVEVLS